MTEERGVYVDIAWVNQVGADFSMFEDMKTHECEVAQEGYTWGVNGKLHRSHVDRNP